MGHEKDFPPESRSGPLRPMVSDDPFLGTMTLDPNKLIPEDVTVTGSFDMGGIQGTSMGMLLGALPIPSVLLDISHTVLFTNRACEKFHPDPTKMWLNPFLQVFSRPSDAQRFREALERLRSQRRPQVIESMIGVLDRRIWGRILMRSVKMRSDRFILVLIEDLTPERKQAVLANQYAKSLRQANDELESRVKSRTEELAKTNEELRSEIEARRNAQESLKLAAKVITASNEAIMVTDAGGDIVEVNAAFSRTTGYAREEAIGRNPRFMASGRHDKHFWRDFWHIISVTGQWKGEVWDRRKSGEIYPKLLSVSTVKDDTGKVTNYVGIFSDITKAKQTEERLEHLAHYDPLTELPNRLLFRDRLRRALVRADRDKTTVALMFLDLDAFKNVNDTVGHPLGDELLVQVAGRLAQCVRKGDTVARLGGDEFTVVVPDLHSTREVGSLAQRIVDELSAPFRLKGYEVFTSASIGIAIYPGDARDPDRLVQHADTAMYHAKNQGKNNFQFFSNMMNIELKRVVAMETTLRRAMEGNGLEVYYQPITSCKSGGIVGAEALLRLRNARGQVVSAGPYIPVAEEKGLIGQIGEWVLKRACRQIKAWQSLGLPGVPIAVNVSMRQMRNQGFEHTVLRILEEAELSPSFVVIELTESAMMANVDHTVNLVREFRNHGISVSIDDFGTGYSSLSYLRYLPIEQDKDR
ncbi:MAG: diguanylate cyclase [Thermodesulfobacteriota bacterium]